MSVLSAFFVFVSIGTFGGKTLQFARVPEIVYDPNAQISLLHGLDESSEGSNYPPVVFKQSSSFFSAVFYIDLVCNAW